MYKLYDGHATGGVTIRAALNEAGVDYKVVDIDLKTGKHLTSEYKQINPCQQVPALKLPDGSVLAEIIAILMHIADAHPESQLAPACGSSERAQINRWLSFFAMNIYVAEYLRMRPDYYTTDSSDAKGIAEAATEFLKRHYEIFEGAVGSGPYFLGSRFSILDIYIWMLVQWWDDHEFMRRNWPKTLRLVETVQQRPKIKPIHNAHFGS